MSIEYKIINRVLYIIMYNILCCVVFKTIKNIVVDILEGVFGDDSWEEIVYIIDRIRRLILFHSSVKFMLHVHIY